MKIHEYQAKEILRRYGVPVPTGARAPQWKRRRRRAKTLFSKGNLAGGGEGPDHAEAGARAAA